MAQKWDRIKNEQNKAYHSFCIYRDLGPFRSIDKVVQKLDEESTPLSRTQVGKYSSKYNWVERAEAYDDYKDKKQRQKNENAIIEMNKRQANDYKKLQEGVMDTMSAIDEIDSESEEKGHLTPNRAAYFLNACSMAYDRAAKGERLARGEATDRTEQSGKMEHSGSIDTPDSLMKESQIYPV